MYEGGNISWSFNADISRSKCKVLNGPRMCSDTRVSPVEVCLIVDAARARLLPQGHLEKNN